MKIAAFQFDSGGGLAQNFSAIERAISEAAKNKVRLLVFHECALSGYPPVDLDIGEIDFRALATYTAKNQQLAKEHDLYIAIGTIREQDGKRYNSTLLINPDGEIAGIYDKRALWGWDLDYFAKGDESGIFEIDGVKVGFRICFEVRFPEYFRELFKAGVQLCFVSFHDVLENDSPSRYERAKAYLLTRAMENIMTVISVNSTAKYQTAPTAVFDINGVVIKEAPRGKEHLMIYDYQKPEIDFGTKGRIENSKNLLNM